MFDVIIAGGGPAGLQAALVLGRARRRALLCDTDEPRNSVTGVIHGFLTRDGVDPADLRRTAEEELSHYPTVEIRPVAITDAQLEDGQFTVALGDGVQESADRLILATGVVDELPAIPGLDGLWGRSVFHCVYCDGYERREQPLAVLDASAGGGFYALQLTGWSSDVVLCTNGATEISDEDLAALTERGIPVREAPIVRLEDTDDGVTIVFADDPPLERHAIFVRPPTHQRSNLAAQLGCNTLEDDSIEVNDFGQTSVPGVFAAGDMSRRPAMPFPAAQAIHAASAGGIAAAVADMELMGRAFNTTTS